MKLSTLLMATSMAVLLMGTTRAQVLIVHDGTTFTPPADSISNLPGYSGAYDGSRDFTNNYPVPGQTFTTVGAGALSSITLQDQGSGNGFENATYALGIYSVSGTTLTYLGGDSFTFGGNAISAGDYFTLNLTAPVAVSAGTQYAFTFNSTAGGGYLGLDGGYPANNPYAGGQAIVVTLNAPPSPTAGGTLDASQTPYDRNFSITVSAVPEPSTWAMMFGGVALLFGIQRFRRAL